jgi:hypothetical protein
VILQEGRLRHVVAPPPALVLRHEDLSAFTAEQRATIVEAERRDHPLSATSDPIQVETTFDALCAALRTEGAQQ